MKPTLKLIAVIFITVFTNHLQSQSISARIEKNRNIRAKDLIHDLNKTKDTLVLRSEKVINALYTSNNNAEDFHISINEKEFKLPLNKLEKGKNVLVAVQSPLRIIFVVHIPEDNLLNKVSKKTEISVTTPLTKSD